MAENREVGPFYKEVVALRQAFPDASVSIEHRYYRHPGKDHLGLTVKVAVSTQTTFRKEYEPTLVEAMRHFIPNWQEQQHGD